VRPFLLAALLLVLLAGCGSDPAADHSLAKSRECLAAKGVQIVHPRNDIVASTASGGMFRAYLHGPKGNFVTLSFAADAGEAQTIALGYDQFHARNIGVADILYVDRNVTELWGAHPSTGDAELVTGCLK
jgi:hypothetical protein